MIRAEPYDEKCDVYSFGMLLLDMTTGTEPLLEFIVGKWCKVRLPSGHAGQCTQLNHTKPL